jgi:phosphatidylserine synthase 2
MSYAEDCTLIDFSSPNAMGNIWNALFDVFTFGHFIGWFSKAIILRDFKVLVFASLAFEGLEFALRNIINNFRECWWDHLILDFSMFNFLGIAVGYQVLTFFNCERYNWCSFS